MEQPQTHVAGNDIPVPKSPATPTRPPLWLAGQGMTESRSPNSSPVRAARLTLWLTIAMLACFLLWAGVSSIDQVVHVQGQVIASSRTQVVQAAENGVLRELKVNEGDQVARGQIVAVLEKERATAAYNESHGKVTALRMTVERLRAEMSGTALSYPEELQQRYPELVKTQMNLYRSRRNAFESQLSVLQENVRLTGEELKMNLPLEDQGDVSRADILRLRRAANDAQGQLVAQRSKYLQDASAELNKAQEDLNAQEQILADRQQQLEHTDLVAPATGIVKAIRVTTLGGVVRQGDELLQILPTDSDLVIEAKVKPADMAYVEVGMPASVKLDAYDYSIFGTMNGTVTYVSADTLTEESSQGQVVYYRLKVRINDSDYKEKGKRIEVRPGMTANVDIRSGERNVLMYILKPLTKTLSESLGER